MTYTVSSGTLNPTQLNYIIFTTACTQNVRLQHECKHIDADATRQQHIQ